MKIKDLILEIRRVILTRAVEVTYEDEERVVLKIPVSQYSIGYLEIVIKADCCILNKQFTGFLSLPRGVKFSELCSHKKAIKTANLFFKNRLSLMKESSMGVSKDVVEKDWRKRFNNLLAYRERLQKLMKEKEEAGNRLNFLNLKGEKETSFDARRNKADQELLTTLCWLSFEKRREARMALNIIVNQ